MNGNYEQKIWEKSFEPEYKIVWLWTVSKQFDFFWCKKKQFKNSIWFKIHPFYVNQETADALLNFMTITIEIKFIFESTFFHQLVDH